MFSFFYSSSKDVIETLKSFSSYTTENHAQQLFANFHFEKLMSNYSSVYAENKKIFL